MRQAGTLTTKQHAQRFVDYLLTLGITAKVEPAGEAWSIWVHDENQIPRSKQELTEFERAPEDARYQAVARQADEARRQAALKQLQAQRNFHDMRNLWANPARRRPVTMSLIVASVVVTLGFFGIEQSELLFSLPEIMHGEIWRLVTPIFMHASLTTNPLHLVFNMYWLYELGSLIEWRLGTWRYVLLVLAIALPSNLGQYLMSGAYFGGMSGVVYGLFGYAWVRGRIDPTSGFYLRPDIAFWMMMWFGLCLVGVVSNVANTAHGVGLAAGALLGALPYWRRLIR